MEAVDWSMNDRSSGLIDWRTASTVGARLASAGAPLTDLDRARLDDDFAEAVPKAEALVVEFTGLHPQGYSARPWVMSRPEWIDANLRGFLTDQIETYLSAMEVDPKRLLEALKRAVEEVRKGGKKAQDLIFLLMTPEQRAVLERVQGVMSLLEGHANFVMDRVGTNTIAEAARMRRSLQARRHASGIERTFQRVIGFESKIRQYDVGEKFVAEVVEAAGMDAFNRVWESEANLPTMAEVMKPADWLARVAPS